MKNKKNWLGMLLIALAITVSACANKIDKSLEGTWDGVVNGAKISI